MSFTIIQQHELPTWVEVFANEGINDPVTILNDLKLIDDLLVLQKSQSLLTRKVRLKTILEARIGKELGHKVPNLNCKANW